MRVGIVGLGYVGMAIADAIQSVGHDLVGIDINTERLKHLEEKSSFFVTDDFQSLKDREIVIVAVPTPLDSNRDPDLSYLTNAVGRMKGSLPDGTLIINESTSYPGTLREIFAEVLGENYLYASSPERVDPGNAFWGVRNTPRIVGGLTEVATLRARDFYLTFCDHVIPVSSPEVAEASKLFENTFRQVNIALVNEFAQIANALGIPTSEVLEAAGTKPYGFLKFTPSLGVGGHCIPVDPSYLSFKAEQFGIEARFINLANQINAKMPEYVVKKIKEFCGEDLTEKKIQVVGISYKPGIPDVRESPAIDLISILRSEGADVAWHDPVVGSWGSEESKPLNSVDIGIIATSHPNIDFKPWHEGRTIVFDVSSSPKLDWPKFL